MTSPESNIQSEDGASITVADGVFKLPTAMPPRVQQIRPVPPGSLAEKSQLLHQISMVQVISVSLYPVTIIYCFE